MRVRNSMLWCMLDFGIKNKVEVKVAPEVEVVDVAVSCSRGAFFLKSETRGTLHKLQADKPWKKARTRSNERTHFVGLSNVFGGTLHSTQHHSVNSCGFWSTLTFLLELQSRWMQSGEVSLD